MHSEAKSSKARRMWTLTDLVIRFWRFAGWLRLKILSPRPRSSPFTSGISLARRQSEDLEEAARRRVRGWTFNHIAVAIMVLASNIRKIDIWLKTISAKRTEKIRP